MGKGREFLDRIYALEDEGDVRTFYDEAAGDYDEILLAQVGYVSPTVCAHAIAPYLPDKQATLIDLGCGTGLAGEALAALGYTSIDGVDISTRMLAVATCLSLTKEPYHRNENIDGWVCVLRVTHPGFVP